MQALYQWRVTEQPAAEIKQHFIGECNLRGRHLQYFHQLIKEVPAHVARIDECIAPHLDRDADKVDVTEQAILRLAAYELLFAPDVPVKVVLDEAVELARLFCAEHAYKYVNAVLDKVARDVRGDDGEKIVGGDV